MSAPLLPVVTLLLISAITPGPNNLIVLRAASRGGTVAALPAIVGVLLGGLALLLIVVIGLGTLFVHWPWLRLAVALCGSGYLVVLGLKLMRPARGEARDPPLPTGWLALSGFQFLNPKGWVMVLTVTAAWPAPDPLTALMVLAPLFIVIPAACLLLWAMAGGLLTHQLARPAVSRRVDRVLGVLLIASAVLLFI